MSAKQVTLVTVPTTDTIYGNRKPLYFNSDARPGFGKALSKEYSEWSEANPGHSKKEGMAKHAEICARLEQKFPTFREIYES